MENQKLLVIGIVMVGIVGIAALYGLAGITGYVTARPINEVEIRNCVQRANNEFTSQMERCRDIEEEEVIEREVYIEAELVEAIEIEEVTEIADEISCEEMARINHMDNIQMCIEKFARPR